METPELAFSLSDDSFLSTFRLGDDSQRVSSGGTSDGLGNADWHHVKSG